jgi:hypothetical protein
MGNSPCRALFRERRCRMTFASRPEGALQSGGSAPLLYFPVFFIFSSPGAPPRACIFLFFARIAVFIVNNTRAMGADA